jgi:hypothetical protein
MEYTVALLRQVYAALSAEAYDLAAMGIRTIWERMMIDQVGNHGTFVANLAAYERSGAISAKQRAALETVLETGHAATHRGFRPQFEDIATLLDVTEGLLRPLFDANKVTELRERIPPRKP